jgi:hypothetical protein
MSAAKEMINASEACIQDAFEAFGVLSVLVGVYRLAEAPDEDLNPKIGRCLVDLRRLLVVGSSAIRQINDINSERAEMGIYEEDNA